MAKKAGFVYRGRDRTVEDVTRRSQQKGGNYDGILLPDVVKLKVKEGENEHRILPPTWEDVEKYGTGWEVQIQVHYNIGPDRGMFLCLDKMKGEPCPICEARRTAADDEEADALRPSTRALCWDIDRNNEKAGPQIWDMPLTLFRDINARSIDKKTNAVICIDDPEEGYDLSFNREGTDMRTKYTAVEVSRDPSPVHDDQKIQDKWLNYIQDHPLPDVLCYQDADYIEKVLSGRASSKRDKDEDEEEETSTRGSLRRPRKPVEEEEEEEAPATSSRRGSSRKAAEPEEEEEEPAPRSTRRRPAAEPEEEEAEEEPAPRSSRKRAEPEPEEEEDEPPPPRSTRRRVAAEPEEEEEETLPESRTARKGLERLRPGRR